jgi:[ribosomal protein S5]-alanine N-acetyltransferase
VPPQPPYFLNSPRLGLRTWSPEDLPLAQSLWGNLEVTKTFGGPFSELQIQERLTREIANQVAHNLQYWPVFLLATEEFSGCCGLRPYDLEKQIFELGFHFLPKFWGKGLATEAAQTVIAYAFGPLKLKGLFAGHHPDNAASARVLQKLGFRYTHDELYPPTGLMNPSYFLAPSF